MIGLVHGYGLSGSGSNLWTRSVAEALCYNGEDVHLICQERTPEALPFVAEAVTYNEQGKPEGLFSRETDYAGRCTLHRPELDLLPVYVRPESGDTILAYLPDLSNEQVETYLQRNERALRRIVEAHGLTALHVNHAVLMSVVCQRVNGATGVPFAVMPHGSAIEYVVKRDERMQRLAAGALTACQRIFVLSNEIQERLRTVFPRVPGLTEKMRPLKVGVNTRQFELVGRSERPERIERVKAAVEGLERGKTPGRTERMQEQLEEISTGDPSRARLQEILDEAGSYAKKRPDADLEAKLDRVDWAEEEILTFVGRLIRYKGIHSIVAALPLILEERPRVRVVMAGSGPLREVLEALVWALAGGRRPLVEALARHGGALEGESDEPLETITRLLERLEREGRLERYFATAEERLTPGAVVFTGYLDHDALCHLFPCCDVAIFPSTVAEGSPLVIPEAMASGCYPMGSDFAGMKDSLDVVAAGLPDETAAYLRLRPEPEHTAWDIAQNVPGALALQGAHREALRRVATEAFSWRGIAETLTRELASLAPSEEGRKV